MAQGGTVAIPLATGERLFAKWGFRELLEKQVVVSTSIYFQGPV